MLARGGENIAAPRRIGMQRPVRARVGLAFGSVLGPGRRLLPFARRDARIVRRLWRRVQFGAKLGVLRPQRRDLARQPLDRLELHQNDADQSFSVKRIKEGAIHRKFESPRDSAVKPANKCRRSQKPDGGEQLH
jgi:hypothetical protein